ncbi:MAG: UDP-2,4-diacetamido-2,4,6-trideoxy-beta-L-altropyranose hydrolase [Dethiobacter sp.]|jgi:UDP-2,4-diacetamido-2,4,6-trideoxy-beta-L-altropyranose hydrolase|nr:UDP-2,4-diacetamido-2,4,6-trideoxy-beta-L-altropyranose hydrolase [Dethiobacter sp.]
MRKKILLRAEASNIIGIGHMMRSFALAQYWKNMGGQVVFLSQEIPETLEKLLVNENMKLIRLPDIAIGSKKDAQLTADLTQKTGAELIIADGYHFAASYQKLIKNKGLKLLVVDDYGHSDFYAADIILNVGLDANERLYANREPYTQLLLGPEYVPLRQEFLKRHGYKKEIAQVGKKLLITMGGADPDQVTLKVIEALSKLDSNYQVRVVVGLAYNYANKLKAAAGKSNALLLQDVKEIAALMAWADIAISAGGGTLAEMAYMGLPNIVIKIADNQCSNMLYEKKIGASLFLGDAREITNEQITDSVKSLSQNYLKRQQMSANGRKAIDGKGSQRVFEFLVFL